MLSRDSKWSRTTKFLAISLVISLSLLSEPAAPVRATHTTRTYVLESPMGVSPYVSSPPRFHNQCAYTYYVDDPHFDDGTCKGATNVNGNWSMDFFYSATSGQNVYLDIVPKAIDGFSAGGTYRVVAGDSDNWDSGVGNDQYQYFGIHSWNFTSGAWENYAWIVLGTTSTLYIAQGRSFAIRGSLVARPLSQLSHPEAHIQRTFTWK